MRLKTDMHTVTFYDTIGREITAENMRWTPAFKNFQTSFKDFYECKGEDFSDVLMVSKALPIIKW